jgi:hypothetical protein
MMINDFGAAGGIRIDRKTEAFRQNLPQGHLSTTEFPITWSEMDPGSTQ